MISYIAKRLLGLIPVLFVVSIVVFLIIHLTPGDPARVMLGDEATEEQVLELQERLSLNEPLWTQYVLWIGRVVQGDLGQSFFLGTGVVDVIGERLGPTVTLAVGALIVALLISIPLGIAAARWPGSLLDAGALGVSLIGMALPSFLLGLMLALVVGVQLGWLPVAGYRPLSAGLWQHVRYLILPTISLGVVQAALLIRITRASMLDTLGMDYVRLARAKGLSERMIAYRHAFRNAVLPVMTVVGATFGSLVTGALVTETVFNIPGVGQLLVSSIARRDYAVIQGTILLTTLSYVLINLITDLLYGLADPRVRLGNSGAR